MTTHHNDKRLQTLQARILPEDLRDETLSLEGKSLAVDRREAKRSILVFRNLENGTKGKKG